MLKTESRILTLGLALTLGVSLGNGRLASGQEQGDMPWDEMKWTREYMWLLQLSGEPDDTSHTYLDQNHPNPFPETTSTRINFGNGARGAVLLRILDMAGNEVVRIVDRDLYRGRFELEWSGVDSAKVFVKAGIYRYQLITSTKSVTRALIITPNRALEDVQTTSDPRAPYPLYLAAVKVLDRVAEAYATKDEGLYAGFLARDFRHSIRSAEGDSILASWGKAEELSFMHDLLHGRDIQSAEYLPRVAMPKSFHGNVIPIVGGDIVLTTYANESLRVPLVYQEIVLEKREGAISQASNDATYWEIVEWREYPQRSQ